MTRTWKDNAVEFAALDTGEGWPFARLVACSVEKAPNGVRRGSDYARNQNGKVTATEFAVEAGTSAPRVLRYLACWQTAAAQGVVPDADDLIPADVDGMNDPEVPWMVKGKLQFAPADAGTGGGRVSDPDRRARITSQAVADGVGPGAPLNIAGNPKALATAIKSDPATARAAREALDQVALSKIGQHNPPSGPEVDAIHAANAASRLVNDLYRAVQEVKRIAPLFESLEVLPEMEQEQALGLTTDLVVAAEMIRMHLALGVQA